MLAFENYRLFRVDRFKYTLTNYIRGWTLSVSVLLPHSMRSSDGKPLRVNVNDGCPPGIYSAIPRFGSLAAFALNWRAHWIHTHTLSLYMHVCILLYMWNAGWSMVITSSAYGVVVPVPVISNATIAARPNSIVLRALGPVILFDDTNAISGFVRKF